MNVVQKYYTHSGAIGPAGLILLPLCSAVLGVILGIAHAYGAYYIPYVYLHFLITLGVGGILGFVIYQLAKATKVRNPAFALVVGLLAGAVIVYCSWVTWLRIIFAYQIWILWPREILLAIQVLAKEGVWSIFGTTPTGITLYVLWAIEATLIIGLTGRIAWQKLKATPFCERCQRWIKEKDTVSPLEPVANPGILKSQLEQHLYDDLTALKRIDYVSSVFTRIELTHCPACNTLYLLTVQVVTITATKSNEAKTTARDIIRDFIINAAVYDLLKNHWPEPNELQTEATPAQEDVVAPSPPSTS